MSVRFSGSTANRYSSATNLPGGTFTFTCWAMLVTDRNTNAAVFKITGTNNVWLETDSDGTTMKVWDSNGSTVRMAGPNMTIGAWYKLALVSSGANAASLYYADAVSSLTQVDAVAWTVPSGITEVSFGASNAGNEPLDGRIAAVKMWTTALTLSEVDAELNQFPPAIAANLQRYHPFRIPETADYSGNGFTLTAGTGTTTEADPPIPTPQALFRRAARGRAANF